MSETELLLTILEKPHIKKGYEEYLKYLKKTNRIDDAIGFEYLIETKFKNVNDSDNNL